VPDWIQLLTNSGVRLETRAGQQIYIDPWQVPDGLPTAMLIAITHPHYDHCSPADVKKLSGPATRIAASAESARLLREAGIQVPIAICEPGQRIEVGPVVLLAVEAYNINKWRSPGEPFHPRNKNFLGWVLEFDRGRVYHAGDTDVIPPEVEPPIDIAFIPVSGRFVMTAAEAADAVNRLRPALAIPMHYGGVAGTRADAEEFARLASVPVEILS
jgi:L-ascorbate metabolism protein UlaG (beta-lactamase superfamily)